MPDDLARVLELLHSSRRRWRTMRCSGEQWSDAARSQQAFEARAPGRRGMSFRGAPGPDDRDRRWRLWVGPDGKGRGEFGMPHQGTLTVIANGGMVWTSLPGRGGRTQESQGDDALARLGPAGRLVETAVLPAVFDLAVVGETTVAGRPAIQVKGRPRSEGAPRWRPDVMAWGADEVEMAVDVERGVLLSMEWRFEGTPFARTSVNEIAFDEDLPDDLFDLPADDVSTAGQAWAAAAPPSPRPPRVVDGPPDDVIGEPLALTAVLARTDALVVALDRVVAYPDGIELGVTVRKQGELTFGSFDATRPRTWSGVSAFPGESLRVGVVFADGSRAFSQNFGEAPEGSGASLVALNGSGTQARFDQRFWVTPLPPPGPLGLVVAWPARDIAETRVDVPADPIREAAVRARRLWEA